MDKLLRRGSLEMTAAMLISGTIGWFVLVSGQPVLDVVFWRCVFRSRDPAADLRRLRFSASRHPDAHHLSPRRAQRCRHRRQLGAAVRLYSRASIAIGTAVYNVQPFMLVGLAALFLGEKITAQKLFWLSISFAGMLAIVSAHGEQGAGAMIICWGSSWRWGRPCCTPSPRC